MIKLAQAIVPSQLNDYASCGCLQADDLLVLGFRVITIMIGVVGTMFAIGIVYNAIRYFTAYGNEEQAGKAKQGMLNNLLAAVITLTVFVGFRAITVNRLFGLEGVVDTIYTSLNPPDRETGSNCSQICSGRYITPNTPGLPAPEQPTPDKGFTTPPIPTTPPINPTP